MRGWVGVWGLVGRVGGLLCARGCGGLCVCVWLGPWSGWCGPLGESRPLREVSPREAGAHLPHKLLGTRLDSFELGQANQARPCSRSKC